MKRASATILFLCLLAAAAAAQNVKVKVRVRAALYDRDLNLKPVPRLVVKLVPAAAGGQPVTMQTSLEGAAEAEVPAGSYHVVTDTRVELFDKSYRWEFDVELTRPENVLELSNDNAKTSPLAAGRNAHVDELASHYKRVKDAVVTVWTEYGSYDGFVIDPAGLVLTVQRPLDQATWLAVQLDDRRRLPAVLAASDSQLDVAVLRINPSAMPQLTSVQLSTDPDALVEGERAFMIENPGRDKDKKLITGVISKADSNEIISDVRLSYAGGPFFNSDGSVVGLVQRRDNKPRVCPIATAKKVLAEARQKLASSVAPSPNLLPTVPYGEFPAEGLRASASGRWEKEVYSFNLGDFYAELVTPVSSYEIRSERYAQDMKVYGRSKRRMSPPSEPSQTYDPVLVIIAAPKTKMPFWENLAQGAVTNNRGPTILRYKTAFLKMRLLCGDKEVGAIWPGRVPEGMGTTNRYAVIAEESVGGRYLYAHDAISPECGRVTLEVFSMKDAEHPVRKVLDDKQVARIWQDFEPYRKLLKQQSGAPQQ